MVLLFIAMEMNSKTIFSVLGGWYLFEILVSTVLGAAPFTVVGNVVATLFWTRRGNAVSTLPYKFVQIFYIAALFREMSRIGSGGSISESRVILITGLVNSGMLAVLRF